MAQPQILRTNEWAFRVAVAPLAVCPNMLSGPLNIGQPGGLAAFGSPIPYGFSNNLSGKGWIWPDDNTGRLEVDFGVPAALDGFRVFVTEPGAVRGANWAVEYSDTKVTWTLASDFRFVTSPGGGVGDDYAARPDCAGWYEAAFNRQRATVARYWRIRQTAVLLQQAPRCGRVEFYGTLLQPLAVSALMLSGPLDFYATAAGTVFSEPIPYGYANNASDNGWIWPRDNSGLLQVDFGQPQVLNVVRVFSSYAGERRGAVWAIERSDDALSWMPVSDFRYETASGAGVDDAGCHGADFAGWYGAVFNLERLASRYWRIRQVQETAGHAPRSTQMQFFEIPAAPAAPHLEIGRKEGGLAVSWTDPLDTAVLQWAEKVTGPWNDLPSAFSPNRINPLGYSARFYRLRY